MISLNLHHTIIALTEALDFVGVDEVYHGKRVAMMADNIARQLGWTPSQRHFIVWAGMIHDCGVSQTREHQHLTEGLEWEGAEGHCLRGEHYLTQCTPLKTFAPVIRWHHTHWNALPETLPLETRLFSNLIFLADRIDVLQAPFILGENGAQGRILWEFPQIIEQVKTLSGDFFAPELVEAFAHCAQAEAFWLSMDPRYLYDNLNALNQTNQSLTRKELLELASLFSHVVDAKSPYTQDHSKKVALIARFLAQQEGLEDETLDLIEAAGLLHDLGKLRVPDSIIEKPGPLTPHERALIMRHSYDTFRILNRAFGGTPIPYWAGSHHENLLGTGYPFHRGEAQLDIEARILAVADIFQALAQDRPYRGRLPADTILAHLKQLSTEHRIDHALVHLVEKHLSTCYALATGSNEKG